MHWHVTGKFRVSVLVLAWVRVRVRVQRTCRRTVQGIILGSAQAYAVGARRSRVVLQAAARLEW